MGVGLTSFLFAGGVAVWVYNKLQRSSGGLTQKSATAAAAVGIIAFIVFFTIFTTVANKFPQ